MMGMNEANVCVANLVICTALLAITVAEIVVLYRLLRQGEQDREERRLRHDANARAENLRASREDSDPPPIFGPGPRGRK
jgi:hypothetical protein